ncbi:hypothetical protein JXA32_12475 [Candidatus Sumerlaeota bacterium]|nr:hypothetical protein [Candidatus Sumerlaeota bacterium]
MTRDRLIQRVEELIEQGKKVTEAWFTHKIEGRPGGRIYTAKFVEAGKLMGFKTAALSFIERVYGSTHPHFNEFQKGVKSHRLEHAEIGIAILESIRDEIQGDWLFTIKGLITAEVFADFIEMANYLLESKYKDPAAVVAGSVLEEHLRQLCQAHGIDVELGGKPKKADRLNSDLAKANIYLSSDQKFITAWLGLRNNAAHGKYDKYNEAQVKSLIDGVTEFMSRIPV